MTEGKYIFVAGAPGSKWSSVVKNIYYSPSVDRSDYSDQRTYCHKEDAPTEVMHFGAYFDPGMEFGNNFNELSSFNKIDIELEFDKPFSAAGKKIIKSHSFSHHLNYLKENWNECPIVLVYRSNEECLTTWIKAGGKDILYPNYEYFSNSILDHIREQNKAMMDFVNRKNVIFNITNNINLCDALRIEYPPSEFRQDYQLSGVKVAVI